MNEINWEEVETEFNNLTDMKRERLYHDLTHLSLFCKNCKAQQEKEFLKFSGVEPLKKVKLGPWEPEYSNSKRVTEMISSTISRAIEMPSIIKDTLNSYADTHVSYECEKGVEIITKFYDIVRNNFN